MDGAGRIFERRAAKSVRSGSRAAICRRCVETHVDWSLPVPRHLPRGDHRWQRTSKLAWLVKGEAPAFKRFLPSLQTDRADRLSIDIRSGNLPVAAAP